MKRIFRAICVGIFMFFAWGFFLYRKYGNKKYKLQNKTVIVCNHYSTFDAFYIYLIYGRKKIYFITIKETKERCLSRFVVWLFDCLFIDYESNNLGFFKQCLDVLKNDGIICIFPEGAVNPRRFGFFEFHKSFAYFAKKTGANILPIYIYPETSLFKRTSVYIGDVIKKEDYDCYDDLVVMSMTVQSKVMEYSFKVPQNIKQQEEFEKWRKEFESQNENK